ncbi:hypothetical protein AALP_AA4G114400 [Arabis alpina]|uniref:Uncharacterized protein n=2 Tax=Arabis alpina TaxID=50452 RepID=A0A087H2L6_ARAAL|nr:hypothetical protein AALP_AA4G114400 [Arabis alpina]
MIRHCRNRFVVAGERSIRRRRRRNESPSPEKDRFAVAYYFQSNITIWKMLIILASRFRSIV